MPEREPSEIERWAAAVAIEHLAPLGDRWRHTLGVVECAREIRPALELSDGEMLIAAAFVHDVGYAPALAMTGFHPLDGARYLATFGRTRLAGLVAHHGGARHEASLRGLAHDLEEFPREVSQVAVALDYCDLSTGPSGERVGLSQRLDEIALRHGENEPLIAALRVAAHELDSRFEEGQRLLDAARRSKSA